MPKKSQMNHIKTTKKTGNKLKNAPHKSTYPLNVSNQDHENEKILKSHSDWCHSPKKQPQKRITKFKTHLRKASPKKPPPSPQETRDCRCGNVNCECGPRPTPISAGDRLVEVKKPKLTTKSTNASILRDASILLKQEEVHQRKIEALLSATGTYLDYEQYLEELRDAQEKEALVDLEKKRLSGLLSHEEAILAKKRVIEINAEKREEYLKQKAALEKELEAFRVLELAKLREAVQEVKEQHEKTKIAQNVVLQIKQKAARVLVADLKNKLKKSLLQREKEIDRKIKAIREFKVLQQIRKEELNSKEEQMTKLLNVSMEELKARLMLYKEQLREELIRNQDTILKQKCRREMLRNAAASFVREVRKCRQQEKQAEEADESNQVQFGVAKGKLTVQKAIIEDENLAMLRMKLEQARSRRQSFQSKYRKYFVS